MYENTKITNAREKDQYDNFLNLCFIFLRLKNKIVEKSNEKS